MSIEEGNKLIADFMEFSHSHEYYDWDGKHEVKYHTSYDWLMPVVEKIEGLGGAIHIDATIVFLHFPDQNIRMLHFECSTKIQAVWQAVVQFIQWYNQGKNLEPSVATESQ